MRRLLLVLFTFVVCAACQTDPNKPILLVTPEQVVDWIITPRGLIYSEEDYLQYKHQEEIKTTLSIAEVKEVGSLRVIFYSYSIGATVYRKIAFCKKVDEYLLMSGGYKFSSYYADKTELALEYGVTRDDIAEVLRACRNWDPDDDKW